MPHPVLSVGLGLEVRLAVVVDLRGEAQEAPVRVGRCGAGRGGQTVLLVGALQHEHGPVLDVRGLLHHLRVQHQIRSRWNHTEHKQASDEPGSSRSTWHKESWEG